MKKTNSSHSQAAVRLALFRLVAKLSQLQCAKQLGITQPYFHYLETGQSRAERKCSGNISMWTGGFVAPLHWDESPDESEGAVAALKGELLEEDGEFNRALQLAKLRAARPDAFTGSAGAA